MGTTTFSNDQMNDIGLAMAQTVERIENSNPGTAANQATEPELPCTQVEVVSITSSAPVEPVPKEICKARWLTENDIAIKSSLTENKVKIQVVTKGFADGEKLKVKVLDSANKTVKTLELTLEGNAAVSDVFEVEKEWLGKVLFINFES